MKNVIAKFEGDYHFLSNFHEAPTTYTLPNGEAVVFNTGEAAFQAAKMHAMQKDDAARLNYVRQVANAPTPSKAKYAGRSVDIDLELWDRIKVKAMREVVYQKFEQNPALRIKLIQTGHAMLVESNQHNDCYWGRCEGKGFNILGAILMELRGFYLWSSKYQMSETSPEMGS